MTREDQHDPKIAEQAAEAWETFHGEAEASPAEHREFRSWMLRSPENIAAYLRVARAMRTVRSVSDGWPDTPAETLIREAREYTQHRVTPLRDDAPAQVRTLRPRVARTRLAFAMAASLLVTIAAAWIFWTPQKFETRFGEQRFVRLDDGSGVTLNTDSKIEVQLGKDHRVIRLIRGEALFDVAHDASRPFDVYTGKSILRAVGTRFDVDMRPQRTTVTVVEGVVSLTHGLDRALPEGNTPLLRASDRVLIESTGPGAPQHGIRLDETLAWTRQQLIFNDRPLGEVADEFNRYNRQHVVIASAPLRSEKITGVFETDDPASFLAFLSRIPGARVEDDGQGRHRVTLDAAVEAAP